MVVICKLKAPSVGREGRFSAPGQSRPKGLGRSQRSGGSIYSDIGPSAVPSGRSDHSAVTRIQWFQLDWVSESLLGMAQVTQKVSVCTGLPSRKPLHVRIRMSGSQEALCALGQWKTYDGSGVTPNLANARFQVVNFAAMQL